MKKKCASFLMAMLLLVQLMAFPASAAANEASSGPVSLSKAYVTMDWQAENKAAVTINGGGTYRCEVEYVLPGDASDYDHAWLNYSLSGNTLTVSPKRANFAAKNRVARVTVTNGSSRAVLTVTQTACEENGPILFVYNDKGPITKGMKAGTVPGTVAFHVNTKGIRKFHVCLTNTDSRVNVDSATVQIPDGTANTQVLRFSDLAVGNYQVTVYSTNSDTGNDYWCRRKDVSFSFSVAEEHTHSYAYTGCDAAHPHKTLETCACGEVRYTGKETNIFSCPECNPARPVADKDFTSFEEAEQMIRYDCSLDWSNVGEINYVSQVRSYGSLAESYFYAGADGYWNNPQEASRRCTRAASAMALSYMGLNALPKYFDPTNCPYAPYAASLGCTTDGNDNESLYHTYSVSLDTFQTWYERYHEDTVGKYSPIVLHSYYNGGYHAFTVFGRDAKDPAYYYVVDSGTSDYIKRVKLVEVNGQIRIEEYRRRDGSLDYRYGSAYSMMGVWQYVNANIAEAPTAVNAGQK